AERHVGDPAGVACRGPWIIRGEQDGESLLAESSPAVLHHIAFQQHTFGVFQCGIILNDEGVPVAATNELAMPWHPVHWPEQMVVPDFDICCGQSCGTAAEDDIFSRRLQKIVDDLVRTHRLVPISSGNRLRVSAGSAHGNAVKISKERIHYRNVGSFPKVNAASYYLLHKHMDPHTAEGQE